MDSATNETRIRSARELLRWGQERLAVEAKVSLQTVKRFELSQKVSQESAGKLVAALEKAGVLFIGETTINGVSVSGAIALKSWAQPAERPSKRKYEYEDKTKVGRPKGSKNKKKPAPAVATGPAAPTE